MRNPINNKSTLVLSMMVAGALFLGTSCNESRTSDSRDATGQNNTDNTDNMDNMDNMNNDNRTAGFVENDNGSRFLTEAAEMQMEEINLGKLAQQKGNSAQIKELGKQMENDHTKALNELKALAQTKSVTLPTSITDNSRNAYDKLAGKSGNDFDEAYSELMVEKHEDAIKLFEKASTDSDDAEIRTWASQKLSGLRTHLQHAEALEKNR